MRARLASALAMTAVAALAACTAPDGSTPLDPSPAQLTQTPTPVVPPSTSGRPAPHAEVDPAMLPYGYLDRPAVAPGWATAPQEADGVFVGLGPEDAGATPVVAVDSDGTILWRARTPQGTDVDLSRAGDRTLAVLSVPTGTGTGTWAAEAYDLRTGRPAWGPVPLPGAPAEPGLIADTPDGPVAIEAGSGRVLARSPDVTVLAEQDGVVVSHVGGRLRATLGSDVRWTTELSDLGLPADAAPVVPAAAPPVGTLLVGNGRTGTLVDLEDGSAIATDVRDARTDAVLGSTIVLGDGVLSAHAEGTPLWSREVPDDATLSAVDGVLAYLRVGDKVLVVNTATGADAVAYDAPGPDGLAVPAVAGPTTGAVAMNVGTWVLLPSTRLLPPTKE